MKQSIIMFLFFVAAAFGQKPQHTMTSTNSDASTSVMLWQKAHNVTGAYRASKDALSDTKIEFFYAGPYPTQAELDDYGIAIAWQEERKAAIKAAIVEKKAEIEGKKSAKKKFGTGSVAARLTAIEEYLNLNQEEPKKLKHNP